MVEDVSQFLKYSCPECVYTNEDLTLFTFHALQNHENSRDFFAKDEIKVENNEYESIEDPENLDTYRKIAHRI